MLLWAAKPAAAAVARVHVRTWQAAYRGLLPDEYLDGLQPEDRAQRYTFGVRKPHGPETVVAIERGAICGFATTGPSRDDDEQRTGELLARYVDPDWWGLGLGRAPVQDARTCLARQGFERASLWVLVGNRRAERFYRIDGWVADASRRREEIWGVTLDEARYLRPLT